MLSLQVSQLLGLVCAFVLYKIFAPLATLLYYKWRYGEQIVVRFVPLVGVFGLNFRSEALRGDSQVWIRELVQQHPRAKIIATNFQFQAQLTVIDREFARQILTTHVHKYRWTDLLYASEHFIDAGLVASAGNKWRQQRKILASAFHFDALRDRIPTIKEICAESAQRLRAQADGRTPVDVLREMQKITGEVVVRTFFGTSFDDSVVDGFNISEAIASFILDATAVSMHPFYSLKRILLGKRRAERHLRTRKEQHCLQKIEALRRVARETIERRIAQHEPHKPKKDFLDHYLQSYFEQPQQPTAQTPSRANNDDLAITIDEIVHQFITFYFAGMETTANLAAKSLYMLPMYPDVYAAVQSEIDALIRTPHQIAHENLSQLPETHAYLQEILRYSSPAYIL